PESHEEIDKLISYFETIKNDYTVKEYDNIIGFTLNPTKTDSFEFILIEDDIEIQSYVELRMNDSKIVIGKIDTIYSYNAGFFANPFTSSESTIFSSFDNFKKLFLNDYDKDWKRAAVIAYLNENKQDVKIATAKIIGVIDKGKSNRLEMLRTPFEVGKAVYKADKDTISRLFEVNFSGKKIEKPIRVGYMKDTDIDVFIDAEEVLSKHMMIVGTTGSGKSYFTTKLIYEFAKECEDLNIIILDPHGEYKSKLDKLSSYIKELEFEDSIIHAFPEETVEFFKDVGLSSMLSSNSSTAKIIKDVINTYIKPYLTLTGLKNKSIKAIIEEIDKKINEDEKPKRSNKGDNNQDENNNSKSIKSYFDAYGKELDNQPKIINDIIESIENKEGKKILILNFKNITYPETRANIAGLVMQHIFNKHKSEKFNRKLIVLEEAHSFAPESKYGDTSSGKDNLALTMARKIASEGRKFGIGLIAVTQRPAQVSKYVLSQMNTQALFRTINSNDLNALSITIEHAGEDVIKLIPLLFTGSCVISGIAISFPVLIDVK
ncbi:MAG: ATP-binding protein, partial [Hydrogenothermaceae bacterium]